MKNSFAIGGLSRQLQKVGERIDALADSIRGSEETDTDLAELYESQLLDEVGHAQTLVLKMTELLVEATGDGETEANADEGCEGSVFAEGDLTAKKGEAEGDGESAPQNEGEGEK